MGCSCTCGASEARNQSKVSLSDAAPSPWSFLSNPCLRSGPGLLSPPTSVFSVVSTATHGLSPANRLYKTRVLYLARCSEHIQKLPGAQTVNPHCYATSVSPIQGQNEENPASIRRGGVRQVAPEAVPRARPEGALRSARELERAKRAEGAGCGRSPQPSGRGGEAAAQSTRSFSPRLCCGRRPQAAAGACKKWFRVCRPSAASGDPRCRGVRLLELPADLLGLFVCGLPLLRTLVLALLSLPVEFAQAPPGGTAVAVAAAALVACRIEFGGRDGMVGWQP